MASVKLEVDGDVIIYNVGDDADLAEFVAELCETGYENAEAEVL